MRVKGGAARCVREEGVPRGAWQECTLLPWSVTPGPSGVLAGFSCFSPAWRQQGWPTVAMCLLRVGEACCWRAEASGGPPVFSRALLSWLRGWIQMRVVWLQARWQESRKALPQVRRSCGRGEASQQDAPWATYVEHSSGDSPRHQRAGGTLLGRLLVHA